MGKDCSRPNQFLNFTWDLFLPKKLTKSKLVGWNERLRLMPLGHFLKRIISADGLIY